MPKKKAGNAGRKIDSYQHDDKDRVNNPPVGLVAPETDKDTDRKTYSYDPHLDPQLVWAGKAEHTSFDVGNSFQYPPFSVKNMTKAKRKCMNLGSTSNFSHQRQGTEQGAIWHRASC